MEHKRAGRVFEQRLRESSEKQTFRPAVGATRREKVWIMVCEVGSVVLLQPSASHVVGVICSDRYLSRQDCEGKLTKARASPRGAMHWMDPV